MDKETLSNYGWIVICVLVLAVMIALATPFGSFVSDAVKSTTQGLFDVNQSALNSTGLITVGDQEFDVPNGNAGEGENSIPTKKEQKDTVIKVLKHDEQGVDFTYDGQTKTFENVEINTTENTGTYPGFGRMKGTFTDCVINGTLALYDDCTFIDCEFNISGDKYNIWTWTATNVTFKNCTFYSDGKAVLLYGGVDTKLTVENCTFIDNGGLSSLKAAIEIGNDYNRSYNVTVNNTVVHGYEINDQGINTGTTLWANKNSMGKDKLNVVVDGVDVY